MSANQRLSSADSGEPTGARTPADALGVTKRMSTENAESQESYECPTCGRDDFASVRGMRVHHSRTHGESLATIEFECTWCGVSDQRQRNVVEQSDNNFCSIDCKSKWWKENKTGAQSPRGSGRDTTVCCANCQSELDRKPAEIEMYNWHFCNMGCKSEFQSKNQSEISGWGFNTGSDHPQWSGGEYAYGEGWNDEKKESIRARDSYECQDCGMTNPEHKTEYGRALSVHHIRPAREFDDGQKCNDPGNLITFCILCHNKWEGIPLRPQTE